MFVVTFYGWNKEKGTDEKATFESDEDVIFEDFLDEIVKIIPNLYSERFIQLLNHALFHEIVMEENKKLSSMPRFQDIFKELAVEVSEC